MSQIHAEASQTIAARSQEIYAILSDYRTEHPNITPKPYFSDVIVEQGGQGAGTVYRVTVKVMGVATDYQMEVSEPEPGRVLAETDLNTGLVTTFTVEPLDDGKLSRVTIATDFKGSPGFKGFMEKLMNPPVMRSLYKKELQQLAAYVRTKNVGATVS